MPDFTQIFGKVNDVKRRVLQPRAGELSVYDNDGGRIRTVDSGWYAEEITGEQIGGRVVELKIVDLEETDFSGAVFFAWNGYRYERQSAANPPVGNPRQWTWNVVPVGTE